MSQLADFLAAKQAVYERQLAAFSRAELLEHLRKSLAEARKKQDNPLARVDVIKRFMLDDPIAVLRLGFDPKVLHVAIAQCVLEGIDLPHECMFFLARGVVEPKHLRRKKGKTHTILHHEIWHLCKALHRGRGIAITSGVTKKTNRTGDTACGLVAEAGFTTESNVRDIYYDLEQAYREICRCNIPP
jgi:hypothetical protein